MILSRKILRCLAIGVALLVVSTANATPPHKSSKKPSLKYATKGIIAEIDTGKVLGRKDRGVYIFKGLLYARAERWEMPVKPAPWDGLLNAQYQGPVSPRLGGSGEYMSDPAYYLVDESEENFLNLNVWTTSMNPGAANPVIVWLHGGGYSNGSSLELETYDGYNLSQFGDAVIVSVNHRLNYLGYGVDLSEYAEKFKYSANAGHADLIMALEWVRDNISTFGGNPDNVTIWGQSGGAGKVSQLMAMPSAQGLFKRAIAMSTGSFTLGSPDDQLEAQENTADLISIVRESDPAYSSMSDYDIIEVMQDMPYRDLAEAASAAGISAGAVVDGDYVLSDISLSAGSVELIVGTVIGEFNSGAAMGLAGSYRNGSILVDEDRYFSNNNNYLTESDVLERYADRYGDNAEAAIAAFQKAYPGHDLFDGLYVDTFIRPRGRSTALEFTNAGGTAFNYIMAYTPPMFGGIVNWHTGDVPYYFKNLDKVESWVAGDEKVANKVSFEAAKAIISFARNGNPSWHRLPWPVFTSENQEVMVFDRKSEARNYADFDKDFQELN